MAQTTYFEFIEHLRMLKSASILVFDGYSGLGYANLSLVKTCMRQEMLDCLNAYPGTLYVVAGATADGIGACYDVALELRQEEYPIQTVGLVSQQAVVEHDWGCALPSHQIEKLDHLMLIADPQGTWQVLNEEGRSLMIDVGFATHHPVQFSFYGGGAVARSELLELEQRLLECPLDRVQVVIRHGVGDYSPIASKAQKKYDERMQQRLRQGKSLAQAQADAAIDVDGTTEFHEGTFQTPVRRTCP